VEGRLHGRHGQLAADHGARVQRDQEFGQGALFAGGSEGHEDHGVAPLSEAPAWSDIELLNAEKEAVGLFWTGHPIDSHAADLLEFGARTIADLQGSERIGAAEDEAAPPPMPAARGGETLHAGRPSDQEFGGV